MLPSLLHPLQGGVEKGGQSKVLSPMQRGAGGCGVTWELGHCCHWGTWLLRSEVVCMEGGGAAHRLHGGGILEAIGLGGDLLGFCFPSVCYGC